MEESDADRRCRDQAIKRRVDSLKGSDNAQFL
jgi:hypothetical protein